MTSTNPRLAELRQALEEAQAHSLRVQSAYVRGELEIEAVEEAREAANVAGRAYYDEQGREAARMRDGVRPDPTPYLNRETGERFAEARDFVIYAPRIVDETGAVPTEHDLAVHIRELEAQVEARATEAADAALALRHAQAELESTEAALRQAREDLQVIREHDQG